MSKTIKFLSTSKILWIFVEPLNNICVSSMPPVFDWWFLTKGKFYVWKGKFAIVKSRKPLPNYFAIIKDKKEITVIIDQSKN